VSFRTFLPVLCVICSARKQARGDPGMSVDTFELILVTAVFLGAIVQGFSGFAFSAVAGAILLQVQAPGLAILLLMICSLLIQAFVLVRLRAAMSLQGSLPYLVGALAAWCSPPWCSIASIRTSFGNASAPS
jgi:hypothetical protein